MEGLGKKSKSFHILDAINDAQAGAAKYAKNPSGYCFVAGTLVLTTIGLVAIENIQPGDIVYAKEAVGVEQSVDVSQDSETAPVLEVFSHEVDETYVVTIDGEDIETTANHPFYDENGEQVEAKDLEEGDELTTEDGDTATVDSVECIHHDEPVMVYNFCVMEDHTYFVGEHGVLVHNECDNKLSQKINEAKEKFKQDSNGRWHRSNGQFASNKEVGLPSKEKPLSLNHGNALSDTRTNYGYALVDKDTNEILKFGETLYPDKRYSSSFLSNNNAVMKVMESGSKADIHGWQHDLNMYYKAKYGSFPPLNKRGW